MRVLGWTCFSISTIMTLLVMASLFLHFDWLVLFTMLFLAAVNVGFFFSLRNLEWD